MSSPQPNGAVVGIDVGKRTCHVCIRLTHDPTADPAHHFAAPRAQVADKVLALLAGHPPAMIAIERTGGLEQPILDALEQSAHTLYIANHMDSKAERRVHDVQRKTDANDADLLSLMCISSAHPTKAATRKQTLWPWETIKPTTGPRDEVRWYQALIAEQTKAKNRLSAEPDPLHHADLEQQLALIKSQVAACLERMTARLGPAEQLLMTIPTVTARRACVMTAAIGNVSRFETPDKLVGYLALKPPWRDETGGKGSGKVHIPKGLTLLHSELFMAALAIASTKRDCSLTRTFQRIKARSGGKIAILAVRRQIVRTAWGILMTGEPYRDSPALKTPG